MYLPSLLIFATFTFPFHNNIHNYTPPPNPDIFCKLLSLLYQSHLFFSPLSFGVSSLQTLKPADFRGFGRGEGAFGGLNHDAFASFCPPDVQPNTRIIAVCGASDTTGYGSLDKDGWFFSDFYLFYHLLQDSRKFKAPQFQNNMLTHVSSYIPFGKSTLADLCRTESPGCKLQRIRSRTPKR